MPPHSPDLPELPRAAGWPARPAEPAAHRPARPVARAMLAGLAGVLSLLMLAAWAVPPLLDWGRFRTGIAAIAAAGLGRPVSIGGEVTLRLFPEAVLTAADVTLPDQGDGVSARIGALRLQVAVLPLLAGRIVPRDLVLGAPVLRLPWPLPETLAHPARPRVPHAFAAHVENGTLDMGEARVTGINAGIHAAPEPSAIAGPGLLPHYADGAEIPLGFGAEGFAAFGGRSWRFTSALGAPDSDGVSAIDLAVSGQGAAGQTGGNARGTLADGVVQGHLVAGGPDLSLLMPAAQVGWHAEAPFVADGERLEIRDMRLLLGGAPVEASLTFHLAPARLDGTAHAAALDLDGWARVLGAIGAARGPHLPSVLPGRLDLSADTARLLGGAVQALHGVIVSDGTALSVEAAQALLPGRARLEVAGELAASRDGMRLTGPARLDAPDLPQTLVWLRQLAPSLVDLIPHRAPSQARLAGTLSLGRDSVSVSALSGTIGDAAVSGGLGVGFGARPRIGAALSLDRLSFDDWTRPATAGPGAAQPAEMLAQIGERSSSIDGDVHLSAQSAGWHGRTLSDLHLDCRAGPSGLAVDGASATLAGVHLSASGQVGPDGAVAAGRLAANADGPGGLRALFPAWTTMQGLQGPGSVAASVSGTADALGVELRADLGDLVLEAEGRGTLQARTASGTVTLRHPGAPRLLAAIGLPGAEHWLNTGSVALRAHVSAQPGQLVVDDFDLAAADLRFGGRLTLDLSKPEPVLRGTVASDLLALPDPGAAGGIPAAWLQGWGAALTLTAAQLTVGGHGLAEAVTAELGLGGGVGLIGVSAASAAGGHATGQIAFDAAAPAGVVAIRGSLTGGTIADAPPVLPVGLEAGSFDATLDLQAHGTGAALGQSLAGDAAVTLRGARLAGFDLSQAGRVLAAGGTAARPALAAALSRGSTAGLSGTVTLALTPGQVRVEPSRLVSDAGAVSLRGGMNLSDGVIDLALSVMPTGFETAGAGVQLSGPWNAAHAAPQLGSLPQTPSPAPTHKPRPRRKSRG